MESVRFRSDMTVELVKASASDNDVLWAARVSTKGEQSLDEVGADAVDHFRTARAASTISSSASGGG